MKLSDEERLKRYGNRKRRGTRGWSKRILPTERNLRILGLFFDHGYLTSEMVREFVAPNTGKEEFSRVLKRMFDRPNAWLDWPDLQWKENGGARNLASNVYSINAKGIALLVKKEIFTPEQAVWRSRFMQQKYREFWHDLAMGNITASIRLAAERAGYEFFSPFDILAKAPKSTQNSKRPFTVQTPQRPITPDYLYGLRKGKPIRFGWYEQDEATEPGERITSVGSSFKRKLEDCDAMLAQELALDHFDLPNLEVVTVTPTEGHLATIMKHAAKLRASASFLFKALDAATDENRVPRPVPRIFTEGWKRAGHDNVRIDRF